MIFLPFYLYISFLILYKNNTYFRYFIQYNGWAPIHFCCTVWPQNRCVIVGIYTRMFLISRENISSASYSGVFYILYGLMGEKSLISSFFTHYLLFDYMPALSFLLYVFQYLAKRSWSGSSHISLSFKFSFLCPFLLFPHYFTKFSYTFLEFCFCLFL